MLVIMIVFKDIPYPINLSCFVCLVNVENLLLMFECIRVGFTMFLLSSFDF